MLPEHLKNLLIAPRIHDIEPGMKRRVTCEMDMTVHKRRNQCPLPGGHALRRHTAGRQLVPAVKDFPLILQQIMCNPVLFVTG